jgi:hypothetical protein
MSAFHAMAGSIIALFALVFIKATEWYSMPEVITLSPEQIVLGCLLALIGVIGAQIV